MIVRPSTTITKAYVEQNAVEVLYKDTHMFITQNEKQIWIIDQIISDLNTKREVKLKTGFICFRLLLPVLSWDRRNPRSLVPKCHGSRWKQTDVATADPIAVQGEPFFWHSILVRTNLWLRPQVLITISTFRAGAKLSAEKRRDQALKKVRCPSRLTTLNWASAEVWYDLDFGPILKMSRPP